MADATVMPQGGDSQFHFNVICWNDEPVVTTAQLAAFYGVKPKLLQDNHAYNRARFEEGKHLFTLTGENLRDFRLRPENSGSQISPKTRALTLWTRRGAARHAKMLSSDRAWEVFEALEDSYFAARPQADFQQTDFPPRPDLDRPADLGAATIPQAVAVIAAALEVWDKAQVRDIWNRIGLPVVSTDASPVSEPEAMPVDPEPVKRSEPRAGTDEARILEVIRDAGPDGVMRSVITRRFRTIRAVDIDDILDGFVRARLIRRAASTSAARRSGVVLTAICRTQRREF